MKTIQTIIVDGLQSELNIPVILANQVSPIPKHPYLSFTITTPLVSNSKTWSIAEDGTYFKPLSQIWSITIQSTKVMEASMLSMQAYDWLNQVGVRYLSDNDVIVERVGNISNRDNFLTVGYEYRLGFDVTFSFMHAIEQSKEDAAEIIQTVKIENNY